MSNYARFPNFVPNILSGIMECNARLNFAKHSQSNKLE